VCHKHLRKALKEYTFSLGEDFADTDVQAMIALLCTA